MDGFIRCQGRATLCTFVCFCTFSDVHMTSRIEPKDLRCRVINVSINSLAFKFSTFLVAESYLSICISLLSANK
ncbi:hypothetical protein E4T56_gene10671 [Termitomyces sp. T112]|nr:hypothetical protein E4T56_gene10671 [Termitomyces sp. T112]